MENKDKIQAMYCATDIATAVKSHHELIAFIRSSSDDLKAAIAAKDGLVNQMRSMRDEVMLLVNELQREVDEQDRRAGGVLHHDHQQWNM